MSREFGYGSTFFHQKIADAGDDCQSGSDPLTKAWGKVIDALRDVAWSISSVEAGDAGARDLKIESVKALRGVREALYGIEALTSEVVDVQKDTVNGIVGSLAVVSDVAPDSVTVRLPAGFAKVVEDQVTVRLPAGFAKVVEDQPQRWHLIEGAIDEAVRRKKGYGWTRTSSSSGGGSDEVHYYTNDKTAWRLKKQVRAALANGDVAAALALLEEK
jgi:hypothetical protein